MKLKLKLEKNLWQKLFLVVNMKLFKYVSSERIDILEDGFIRFTQPQMLNDPCEFKPVISSLKNESQINKELCNDKLNQVLDEGIDKLPIEIREQAKLIFSNNEFRNHVVANVSEEAKNLIQNNHVIGDINKRMHSVFEKNIGILSLSGTNNNMLMWSHYADGHAGFVMEFDYKNSFFDQRKSKDDKFRHVVKVKYQDASTYNLHDMNLEDLITKSREWEYENEYRMVVALQDVNKVIDDDIYLFKLPFDVIKSIIFGVKSSNALKNRVKNILKSKEKNHITLFQSKIINGGLEFKIVNLL